jgi:putative tryptophan/tyrosine transport system substrate-binding protein
VSLIRRRDIIALFGATVAACTQQSDPVRRIGILMNLAADDSEALARDASFRQALQELGWSEDHNIRIDYRWGAGDAEHYRRQAAELVALMPDVILAGGGLVVRPLLQATRTVPIVFTATIDPVANGYVSSLARPGGNATGFTNIQFDFSKTWMGLLKSIAPQVRRVAVLLDPTGPIGRAQFAAIEAVAPSVGMDLSPIAVHDVSEMERSLAEFSRQPNGGLVVTVSTSATLHRKRIIALAADNHLPAVYHNRFWVTEGGLVSYGPAVLEQYRQAAAYVDRILKGAKPADLPVQAPTKFEMVVNLKSAEALGLAVPETLLATADEVIQ